MAGKHHTIAIVIPTIGRYAELQRMLESVARQTHLPQQVIIVDEGERIVEFAGEFPQLNIGVLSSPRGSISQKRNAGARSVGPDITLVGFLDDDIVLDGDALKTMISFWESAAPDVAGSAFNFVNVPPCGAAWLKSLRLAEWLGLYTTKRGTVLRSGVHSRIGCVEKTTYVQWLPATAMYRKDVVEEYAFDEWFAGYSYLEDLDLSYRIGKKYMLAVVADARFHHFPSQVGREDPYLFGKKEALNRLYFVRKHEELSPSLCCVAIMLRAVMSLWLGLLKRESSYFKRVAGNLVGLLASFGTGLKPAKNWCPGAGNSDTTPTPGSEAIGSCRHENF
jgi:GT2 family glycosyltransferase